MARCAYCKSETETYVADLPICIPCSNPRGFRREIPAIDRDSCTDVLEPAIVRYKLELD